MSRKLHKTFPNGARLVPSVARIKREAVRQISAETRGSYFPPEVRQAMARERAKELAKCRYC